jgi:hypothetical protein
MQLAEALHRVAQLESRLRSNTAIDSHAPEGPSAPELDSDDDDHRLNLGPDLDGGDSPRSVPRSQFLSGQSVSRPRTIITDSTHGQSTLAKTPAKPQVSRNRDAEPLDGFTRVYSTGRQGTQSAHLSIQW